MYFKILPITGFKVYGWTVQCSGHRNTKACPPTSRFPTVFFQINLKERWGIDVQSRCNISKTVEDRD